MKQFQLRIASENDLDAIVAIDQAAFTQPWQPQTFAQSLQDDKSVVVVAQDEQQKVCAFGVAYTVGDEGEIATLAVASGARGSGLGAQILGFLCDWCASRGARRLFLEVRQSNVGARHLYVRLGFEVVGERPNYYSDGETALLMKKVFELPQKS